MKRRPFYKWGIFWYAIALLCAIGWWTFHHSRTSPATENELLFPDNHPVYYESISLERTACYGTCPVYTVTLHRDGRAEYKPRAHLPQRGDFEGMVSEFEFERLSYFLEMRGFEQMKARYEVGYTDASTCIVKAVSASGTKVVSDYGGAGPVDLWAIQGLIDGIRERIDWKPVSKDSP
jgi:hypothetical protein